ncbi:MAG: hypothetical protein J5898_11450 [Lachnospiraceae bacterium]|nr:hypothetical protein [Lachnospiraceae bacterium]MBP5221906.1 hypothetical protein [Lachnospiraceae bacterium]
MDRKYEDMIDLPHHVSDKRPGMSVHDRAAQFMPFAALTGYEDAIAEEQRITEEFRDADESVKELLDAKIRMLQEMRKERPEVLVTHFVPDSQKGGGSYEKTAGIFLKVDDLERMLFLEQGQKIELDLILEIRSPVFGE